MNPILAMAVVVILDTGLDLSDARFSGHLCRWGHKDFTGEGLNDRNGHGTFVAGLVQEYAKDANYCMVIVKYYGGKKDAYLEAFKYSLTLNPTILNISGGGEKFEVAELLALSHRSSPLIVAAAGNAGQDVSKRPFYPAAYNLPNIISVACYDCIASNYGARIKRHERGNNIEGLLPNGKRGVKTGTSMATAITTGKILHETKTP